MKIPKTKAFAFLILWLYGFAVFANTPNAAKDERVGDSALAIDTSKGTVAVHQSLNNEPRFYMAPNFKFLAVNAKGDVARLGASSATKTDVIMKLRLVVAADRHEVAKALKVPEIWKVGNLPVNAIRVDLKTDALIEKYGIEQAYKIDSPAYTQTLDVVFSVASEQAKEFVRDVNQGKVAFQLTYAFNQINIDSHHEELSARFISDSKTFRRLDQQGKELMTAEQMADSAKSIRKEITSKVITSLGGTIEPRSIPIAKLMELFEVGDMFRKTEAELAEFDSRLAKQLNLRVNPKEFQPFRVQKHVIESLNSTKDVAKQRQSYVRDYNREKTAWNVSASARAKWGWGSARVSGGYATEAKKVSDKTAMSDDQFRDFVAKSHGVEYDTEERLFRGVKIYDTQQIKALGDVKVISVTIKPTLTSGVKRLDLVPKNLNAQHDLFSIAHIVYNSVANEAGDKAIGDANTLKFWQIPYADRLKIKGIPDIRFNYYNPTLYLQGAATYIDVVEDLDGNVALLMIATADGIDPKTMKMINPKFVEGHKRIYDIQFAAGWSSYDYDGDMWDKHCAQRFGKITQHYNQCWIYSLGSDADSPYEDSYWGPHFGQFYLNLNLKRDGGADESKSIRVRRITRYIIF
jgi:hypothetical protein